MKFVKKFLLKIKRYMRVTKSPVGLSSLGLRMNYLENINRFNYSATRFCAGIFSPVKEPFYFKVL